MSNEKREEHNKRALEASKAQSIHDVMFHGTTGDMVQANYDMVQTHQHVSLKVGRATFFFTGRNGIENIVEMQKLGLAIVAASTELLTNGPA